MEFIEFNKFLEAGGDWLEMSGNICNIKYINILAWT